MHFPTDFTEIIRHRQGSVQKKMRNFANGVGGHRAAGRCVARRLRAAGGKSGQHRAPHSLRGAIGDDRDNVTENNRR